MKRKARLKVTSAGWFFGIRYFPDAEHGESVIWAGPFPSAGHAYYDGWALLTIARPDRAIGDA